VSEFPTGEIVLVPSRTRRRLLESASLAAAALCLLLLAAGTAPSLCAAAACALGAACALRGAWGDAPRVLARPDAAEAWRAQSASRMRIVFFAAQRRVVVWHDATDPATYRRLAVRARWPARGQDR
jgi:hypothetical protein